jgi:hypothetical protein
MTSQELQSLLEVNINKALTEGFELVTGDFGDSEKTCCALTANTPYSNDSNSIVVPLSEKYGVKADDLWSVIAGFDCVPSEMDKVHSQEYLAVGRYLRNKFLLF